MRKVGAVTLNYKTPDDTAAAVRALLASQGVDVFVVLVENGSGGDSWERLEAAFKSELRVVLIKSDTNTGFAGGNNLGIRRALAEGATEVFLVSSDVIVESDTAAKLGEAIDRSGAWAAQPTMISRKTGKVDTLGHMVAPSGGVVDVGHGGDVPELPEEGAFEIFGVCAGAALYRREAFEKLGLLPEEFFIYFEDVDMSFRIRLAGHTTVLVPGAKAFHTRWGSAGGWALQHYYAERNAVAVKLRHYTPRDVLRVQMADDFSRALFQALKQRRLREFAGVLSRWLLTERRAPPRARRAIIEQWRGVERRPIGAVADPGAGAPRP